MTTLKLVHETRGRREYEIDSERRIEVHAELVGFQYTVGEPAYLDEAIRQRMVTTALDHFGKYAAERYPGYEGFLDEVDARWVERRIEWDPDEIDEDTGEPYPFYEPYTVYSLILEQGFWPPAPTAEDAR